MGHKVNGGTFSSGMDVSLGTINGEKIKEFPLKKFKLVLNNEYSQFLQLNILSIIQLGNWQVQATWCLVITKRPIYCSLSWRIYLLYLAPLTTVQRVIIAQYIKLPSKEASKANLRPQACGSEQVLLILRAPGFCFSLWDRS